MTTQEEIQKITEERDALQNTLDALYSEAPAEAGFSMNFQISHDVIGPAQVTFRGARAGEWMRVMTQAREFTAYAIKNGWKFKSAPQAAPPPKAAPVEGSTASHVTTPPVLDATVPPPPEGKEWKYVDVQQIKILPQPDDKVKIEFWNPGRKYAEEILNCKTERAAGILKHVTSAPVTVAANLSVPVRVYYVLGKEKANKPGEYWHDVYHVRPDNF